MRDENIDSQALLDEVISYIDEGEFEAAENKARDLQKLGITDGWHLLGVILLHQGEEEAALAVLDEGIAKFPDDFGLPLEKANIYMALERYEEAQALMEEIKPMAGDMASEVEMMQARGEFMQGEVDSALNRLQAITEEEYVLDAFHLQFELLEAVGRTDMILEIATEELESLPVPNNEEDFETMAGILAKVANAYWEEKDDISTARHYLKLAFHYYRNHLDALWLWREIEPEFADSPTAFTIEMNGTFLSREDLGEVSGKKYHTHYGVIADTLDAALAYIKDFDIDAVDKSAFKILSIEEEEAESDEAMGVYWAGDMSVIDEDFISPNGISHN
ncbi:MAG: tetratricopeptide repeat protein [Bacteroidia bacterium]|nr:tetratricopeptide repeat protein [Bacteroidia bacterium]